MTSGSPLVTVIVPAHNEEKHIGLCLASLRNQSAEFASEVIVIDNDSTDSTRCIAESHGVRVIRSDSATPAGVRNDGVLAASGKYVAFIDGDCAAPHDWLATIVDRLESDTSLVAIGGPCLAPDDANWVVKAWAPPLRATAYDANLAAANLALRRKLFDEIGGFNRALVSAEDDDLSRRLRSEGNVLSDPVTAVVHHGYPDSLVRVFTKAAWHGSTQLRAHGWFGDRAVILTAVWLAILMLCLVAVIAGAPMLAGVGAVCVVFILPSLLAIRRLTRARWDDRLRLALPLTVISVFTLAGRSLGLTREVISRLRGL